MIEKSRATSSRCAGVRKRPSTLGKALAEGKLEERLKLLTQPQLLIIDE